jgi:hypothetical protein
MILHHFTSADALIGILIRGILPREEQSLTTTDAGDGLINPSKALFNIPVVWLTKELKPNISTVPNPDRMAVRISVDVSSVSKRLMSWPKWLRKWSQELRDLHRDSLKRWPEINTNMWYIYFGTISPARIRAVETTNQQKISMNQGHDIDPSDPKFIVLKATLKRLAIPLVLPNALKL